MKKYILISLCLLTAAGSFAQNKDFKFKFYGQIRTDFYYNSRANEETVDGLFYMYPKDKVRDEDGNDLNSTPNSNFYTLYSRLPVLKLKVGRSTRSPFKRRTMSSLNCPTSKPSMHSKSFCPNSSKGI